MESWPEETCFTRMALSPRRLSWWPFLSFLSPLESSMLIYFLWAIIYYLDFSCVFFFFWRHGGWAGLGVGRRVGDGKGNVKVSQTPLLLASKSQVGGDLTKEGEPGVTEVCTKQLRFQEMAFQEDQGLLWLRVSGGGDSSTDFETWDHGVCYWEVSDPKFGAVRPSDDLQGQFSVLSREAEYKWLLG